MNRTELIEAISTDTGLSRQQSEAALDALVYEVTAGVRSGSPVRITGIWHVQASRTPNMRAGRNPQTGAPVRIKASNGIGFTPGVQLKSDLNAFAAHFLPAQRPEGVSAGEKGWRKKPSRQEGRRQKDRCKEGRVRAGCRQEGHRCQTRTGPSTLRKRRSAKKVVAKKTGAKKVAAGRRQEGRRCQTGPGPSTFEKDSRQEGRRQARWGSSLKSIQL